MKNLSKFAFGGVASLPTTVEVSLACARLFAGLAMAFGHGIRKVPPPEGFIAGVGNLGFPFPAFFAWAAGLSEFLGGILLAIGLLTRPAAVFLLITMGVAFYSHLDDPFRQQELPLLFFFTFLVFLAVGGGRLCIDRFLR